MKALHVFFTNCIEKLKQNKKGAVIAGSGILAVVVCSVVAMVYVSAAYQLVDRPFDGAYQTVLGVSDEVKNSSGEAPLAQIYEREGGYYLIKNEYQLYELINFGGLDSYNDPGMKFKLANDIELSGNLSVAYKLGDAQGTDGSFTYQNYATGTFQGELDGNGYQITLPATTSVVQALNEENSFGFLFGTLSSGAKVHDLIINVKNPAMQIETEADIGAAESVGDAADSDLTLKSETTATVSDPVALIDNQDSNTDTNAGVYDYITAKKTITKEVTQNAHQETRYKVLVTAGDGQSISENDLNKILDATIQSSDSSDPNNGKKVSTMLNDKNISLSWDAPSGEAGTVRRIEKEGNLLNTEIPDVKSDLWSKNSFEEADTSATVADVPDFSPVWWEKLTDNKYNCDSVSKLNEYQLNNRTDTYGTAALDNSASGTGYSDTDKKSYTIHDINKKDIQITITPYIQYYKRTDSRQAVIYEYDEYILEKTTGTVTKVKAGTLQGQQVSYVYTVDQNKVNCILDDGALTGLPSKIFTGVLAGKDNGASIFNISLSAGTSVGEVTFDIKGKTAEGLLQTKIDKYEDCSYTKTKASAVLDTSVSKYKVEKSDAAENVDAIPAGGTSMPAITNGKKYTESGTYTDASVTLQIDPEVSAGGLCGYLAVPSTYEGIELASAVNVNADNAYKSRISAGGLLGGLKSGTVTLQKSVIDSDNIHASGSGAFAGTLIGSGDSASTLQIKNCFMSGNHAVSGGHPLVGARISLDGDTTIKTIRGASYQNGSETISPVPDDPKDLSPGGTGEEICKKDYGVRYLSKDDGNTYRLVMNWLCTDINTGDLVIGELKNPDSTNPAVDVSLASLKRRNDISIAMDYRYMTITGGESTGYTYNKNIDADADMKLMDISISPVSNVNGRTYKSSWMEITQATFCDGHQYYVTGADFAKKYKLVTTEYQYGALQKAVRKEDAPDNDYISPYISGEEADTAVCEDATRLFYRIAGSDDAYTEADNYTTDASLPKKSAYILFDADTVSYEGFWVVNGYIYPLIKIAPDSTLTSYEYSMKDREPVKTAVMDARLYATDRQVTGNTQKLDTVSHEMDPAVSYNFINSYTLRIKPYDHDSGKGAGLTESFRYYYRIDTSRPSDTDEVKQEIINNGTNISSGGQEISLTGYAEGSTVYLSVVRTRKYRKPSLITYEIHIIRDWDQMSLSANANTLWRDDVLTIQTDTNVQEVNNSYAYASAQNGYDPVFALKGIRYVIRTTPVASLTTLKGLVTDPNLSVGSDIIAAGTIEGDASGLNGKTIPLDCLQYAGANAAIYVYLQFYGDEICGSRIFEFDYQMPTQVGAPTLIPSAGTSQHTAKSIGTGDNAYVVKEDDQVYVYAVDQDTLTCNMVDDATQKRLEQANPSVGKNTPVMVAEGKNVYVGCAGRWFVIENGSVYTDEGISLPNQTGSTVQRTVTVIAFRNGYLPSRDSTFYYSVTPVQAAEAVTFEPTDSAIARFSKVYLKNLSLNSEIYYMADQTGGDFTKSQLADLQSVTYGMNEAGLPKDVYKYDAAKGITVTGDQKINICAVAITEKSLVSPIASKSYDITEPGKAAVVTSVPAGSATALPVVVPGEKILLVSATAGVDIYYSLTGNVKLNKNADGSFEIPEDSKNTTFLYNSTDGIKMPAKGEDETAKFTIYAVAVKKGMNMSEQSILQFEYPGKVQNPVANIASGEVSRGTVIRLSSATEGAVIYYTMTSDGSEPEDPTVSSMTYDKELGITVSKDIRIKAIAVKNTIASKAVSLNYTVSGKLAAPTASLTSGSVSTRGAIVTLSAAEGATIFYTTDNTSPKDPDNKSVMIGNSVILDGNSGDLVTIKAYASLNGKTDSDEATFTYTISQFSGGITADPPSGSEVTAGSIVNLISDVSDAVIHYTTDGSNPTAASKSGNSVRLDAEPGTTVTVKAVAIAQGGETKAYALFSYKLKKRLAKVSATPSGGVLTSATKVTLTAGEGKIYYTTNGEDPTVNSNLYTEPIKVTKGMRLKAIAISEDGETSEIAEFTYDAAGKAATPVSDTASGLLEPATIIHLSVEDDKPDDITIYYSTDGTKPTLQNLDKLLVYTTEGISINRNVTIKAVGYKEGYQLSNVLELEYVVNKIPAVEEKARLLAEEQEKSLHDTDASGLSDRREEFDFSGTAFTDVVLADYDYHAVISAKRNVIPGNVNLRVVKVNSNAGLNDNIKTIFGNEYGVISVYDLSLRDGENEIEPQGTVEIGLPIPKELESAVICMIYIADDGSIQKLETRRDGQMAYAKTDHFSRYALVGVDLSDEHKFSFQWIYVVFIIIGYSVLFVVVYVVVSVYRVEKRRRIRRIQKKQDQYNSDGEL